MLFLLIIGSSISIYFTNKISKSNNLLKTKIFFCIILTVLIFQLITFFWLVGDKLPVNGLYPFQLLILFVPPIILFFLISTIIGLIFCIKRRSLNEFEYNLNPSLIIMTILIIFLVLPFFYNGLIHKVAISTQNENLCDLSIGVQGSIIFHIYARSNCMAEVGVLKLDEKVCQMVCEEVQNKQSLSYKYCAQELLTQCYKLVAVAKDDIEICKNALKEGIPIEDNLCSGSFEGCQRWSKGSKVHTGNCIDFRGWDSQIHYG